MPGFRCSWWPSCCFFSGGIYGEVVGALPLNGGAYNALLNTTSKQMASAAACLTILSYMATAVISANEAMHYLHSMAAMLPVKAATIALLAAFMGLALVGIGESAIVAVVIFITHLASLLLLYWLAAGFCCTTVRLSLQPTGNCRWFRAILPRPCSSASRQPCWGFGF